MSSGMPGTADLAQVLAALQRSHVRLDAVLGPLPDDQLRHDSYDDEWSIAQVASHLGSGAEVFELFVEAGLTSMPAPGVEQFQPIWDGWDARTPEKQATEALRADARLLATLDTLPEDERSRWRLELFGTELTLAGLLRLRLAEHAIHTWDIAVALDPAATVAEDAIELVLDTMPAMVSRVGRGGAQAVAGHVTTTRPTRELVLELTTDGASLAAAHALGAGSAKPVLQLPAEALVRLIYGRLDRDHTPDDVRCDGVDLDVLRRAFPGV
jgi:uncharacterized protein (TIGR03083 family)